MFVSKWSKRVPRVVYLGTEADWSFYGEGDPEKSIDEQGDKRLRKLIDKGALLFDRLSNILSGNWIFCRHVYII